VTEMLRKKGVVGKFVEFFGPGLDYLPLADRATLANMAPEYGATCGLFPIDAETVNFLKVSGRSAEQCALVEAYARATGTWRDAASPEAVYSDVLELDMGSVKPALAGPKRPQDRLDLSSAQAVYRAALDEAVSDRSAGGRAEVEINGQKVEVADGAVVIAAITSCTNTSNPSVMVGAGLVAKKANARGIKVKPWVKTSLAPGSLVVSGYLDKAGLTPHLDALGFNTVGYGCTTCIGNSGPLPVPVSEAIRSGDLVACSVLSGNRNFEGRVHAEVKMNFLASPPLVVAYAIAGTLDIDITKDPIAKDKDGKDVFLKDLWPTAKEVQDTIAATIDSKMFGDSYANVFAGDARWSGIKVEASNRYSWDDSSTYVKNPPYFVDMPKTPGPIQPIGGARVLAKLADSITTDHISPAGSIKKDTPGGQYLMANGVDPVDFNSYGSRRGNHEVMMRGTFANIRIRNEMLEGVEGGYSLGPDGAQTSIYEAAMAWQARGVPLVVFGGIEYGAGSSRDWAAKGTALLGVKAVIAESFERIHRSNLVGMGVIPFEFTGGETRRTLGLKGDETVAIGGLEGELRPLSTVPCTITYADGRVREIALRCRIDTEIEIDYVRHGGVLHYVLRDLARAA
jgi:aconitate hydratase